MGNPTGEADRGALRLDFDCRVLLQFRGSAITSDAELLAYRELDDTLRPTDTGADTLADARTGKWPDVPADRALYDALETGDYAKWHAYKTNQIEEINMPTLNDLIDGDAQRLDTGFTFTEGPLYHPDGFYYFVDVRESKFYRIKPGEKAELLRENTGEGNGTTFDPQGRLIQCEGGNRRVTRWPADGTFASSDVLMDRFDGKRLSRPNDVVCKSDGSVYFTNPGLRIPLGERELDPSAVYRIMPDGSNKHVADFEYPNGLAFSPDERVLYVANTRQAAYIHRIELDSAGNMVRRSIFGDMSSDEKIGVPDGMKVDVQGNVYCTGPGGTWVYAADGTHIGTIKTPEVPANLAFGGPDMKTLFFTAHTSVYSMRVKVAGLPGHPFKKG
jgi:gluconolactonase